MLQRPLTWHQEHILSSLDGDGDVLLLPQELLFSRQPGEADLFGRTSGVTAGISLLSRMFFYNQNKLRNVKLLITSCNITHTK